MLRIAALLGLLLLCLSCTLGVSLGLPHSHGDVSWLSSEGQTSPKAQTADGTCRLCIVSSFFCLGFSILVSRCFPRCIQASACLPAVVLPIAAG